uniref:uncharacterized protein LOC124054270 isoform X5 n=1 Tax=Scatophagus argus TaxID=75038 RepID=UPI001ED82FB6|nr:uncharacterized protein LOC124054270 isoform X5 [Scatophagus argus]
MEAADGFSNVSKTELLRGVVVEKLTAAAQEILAVVERTVACYEEEASGLRQEIDRQRRQLENLLQPRIKLETIDDQFPVCELAVEGAASLPQEEQQHKYESNDQFPVCEPAAGGGAELVEEEEQHKYEMRVEDSRSLGLMCYTEAQMEEEEDQEPLTEPDYQVFSRLLTPTVESDRRSSAGKPRVHALQDHIDLRIRVLEDSLIKVVSADMFKKYAMQEVKCPRGLQEADFLDLLRSTFPQLADRRPFDFFTADKTKRLQPVRVKPLTPEEIDRHISSTGHSALYIRLKDLSSETDAAVRRTQEALKSTELLPRSQTNVAAPASPPPAPDQTRLSSPRVKSDRRKPGRPRTSERQNHVDLRIRILEDSQLGVLSPNVFQMCPVLELQCPRGLQEADFLHLLRSTFPQLAARRPFDFFTIDRTKTLQPLRVETRTPEEIHRAAGHSALYIRLKPPEEIQTRDKGPLQKKDAATCSPSIDQTKLYKRVKSDRNSFSRTQTGEPQNLVDLRIFILEDSQIDVLSCSVYKKYAVQALQCPGGLREADFLDLLRSTFPQLAAGRPFDFFTTDKTKKLQPLRVKPLTPEEINRHIRSTGHSALYIRLKAQEEVQISEEELHRADADKYSSSTSDQTRLNTRVKSDRISFSRPQTGEPQNLVDLRIFILEDSQIDVLSCSVYKKYAVQALQCPGGLREADFLDLLRSTFPQLAAGRPFDFFTTDKTKKLQPLRVKPLTPEEINRHIRSTGHSALYIRLKAQEEVQISEEELHRADADKYSSFTSDQTRLNTSNPVQSSSSTSQHEDVKTEEADNEDGGTSESAGLWSLLVLSDSEGDRDDVSADDWEPNKSEKRLRKSEPKRTKRKRQTGVEHSAVRTMTMMSQKVASGDGDALSCKVCRALRGSMNMLIKHACSHVADPERLCGVCGEHSESAEELRSHLQSHQKTHSCHICGKSFLSTNGLSGHVARHRGHKPHMCKICHKSFTQKWVLKNHMWTHAADKPHKCDLCPKSFVSKVDLTRHRLTHMRESLHRCDACGKSFSSFDRLSKHTSKHSGHTVRETKSACGICSKAFKTRRQLQVHMRVHVTSKPYKCSVCEKAFSYNQCVKRHMKTQHGGPDLCKTEASVQIPSSRINGTKSVFKRVR